MRSVRVPLSCSLRCEAPQTIRRPQLRNYAQLLTDPGELAYVEEQYHRPLFLNPHDHPPNAFGRRDPPQALKLHQPPAPPVQAPKRRQTLRPSSSHEPSAVEHAIPFPEKSDPSASSAVGGTGSQRYDWRLRSYSRLAANHEKRIGLVARPSSKEKGKSKGKTESTVVPFPAPPRVRRVKPPSPHVAYDERFGPEIDAYKNKFETLLEHEEEVQWEAYKERLSKWDLEKLKDEGYAITGLRGFWLKAQHFGKPVASFSLGVEQDMGWNRFDFGSTVTICREHPLTGLDEPINGTILLKKPSVIQVVFEDKQLFEDQDAVLEEGEWRLDFGANDIAFRRMRAAIDALNHDPATQESGAGTGEEYIMAGTFLRDVVLKSFKPVPETEAPPPDSSPSVDPTQPSQLNSTPYPPPALNHSEPDRQPSGVFADNQLIHSWARRYRRANPVVVEGDPILGLNETQTRAVAMMLSEKFSLVQGPPGTGKTKTIIETIKLLKMHFEVPQPLLVATYTNVAVDNLVSGIAAAGLTPLRVGGEEHSTNAKLKKFRLEARIEAHPRQKEIEKIDKEIDKLVLERQRLTDIVKATAPEPTVERRQQAVNERLGKLRSMRFAIRSAMIHEIVHKSDVICTTCITSASAALHVTDFPVVFLDEASMSTEPASLIPLMKGARHVALIGDHKQLPPVITSQEAQAGGLSKSLFERLTEEGSVPSIMLDLQYRMHPSISRFPSAQFYNRTLRDGTVDKSGVVRPSLRPPKSVLLDGNVSSELEADRRLSVVFVDHAGGESKKDRSRINLGEAQIVCGIVEDLLANNPNLSGEDIGIIAPYVAQIALIDRLLKHDPVQLEHFGQTLGVHRALQTPLIEVKTVDGFEGREKEVIIFSTVRNNPQGAIGFLADGRRLNVGLTRARRALFVLGNVGTLREGWGGLKGAGGLWVTGGGDKVWKRYVEWLEKERLIRRWAGGSFLPLGFGKT